MERANHCALNECDWVYRAMTEASHRLRKESLDHYWKRVWKSLPSEKCWHFCENAVSRVLKGLWRLLQKGNSFEKIPTFDGQFVDDGWKRSAFARLAPNPTYVAGLLLPRNSLNTQDNIASICTSASCSKYRKLPEFSEQVMLQTAEELTACPQTAIQMDYAPT